MFLFVKKKGPRPSFYREPGPFHPAQKFYFFAFFKIAAATTAASWRVMKLWGGNCLWNPGS